MTTAAPWTNTQTGLEILAYDWAATPLGPIENWPLALHGTLSTMLACPMPMYLAWGPTLISFFNDAYRPILADRLEGAIGRLFPDLWSDVWPVCGPMCAAALAGSSVRVVDQPLMMDRDGVPTEGWWSFSYSPVHDDAGRIAGMICVTGETTTRVVGDLRRERADRERDAADLAMRQQLDTQIEELDGARNALNAEIGQRIAAEGQVRQLQKMEAVGQLTGGIAHDFNNMLAAIIGGLELLTRKLERGEHNVQRYVDAAMDGATRAAALTQRLLAFSRQAPLAPATVDANRLVSGLTDLLARTLGETIQIETVLAAGLWRTHADTGQLENAIINLSVNARDAMPDGGKLTIETNNAHIDSDYAQEAEIASGQYVVIAVTDTGAGMAREVLEKAFDPFFTTKGVGRGTGLGLSQVFGFVRQSHGHIRIYSEVGHGTTVRIYLPRYYGDEPVPDRSVKTDAGRGGDSREIVLVVEDEDRVRDFSIEALRDLGYTVMHATNGEAALAMLERGQAVTLLFTDVVMPGMTGRVLADRVRELAPDTRVLYTTGYTRNAIVHSGTLDPGTNFLPKPFNLAQLATAVRAAIDGEP